MEIGFKTVAFSLGGPLASPDQIFTKPMSRDSVLIGLGWTTSISSLQKPPGDSNVWPGRELA